MSNRSARLTAQHGFSGRRRALALAAIGFARVALRRYLSLAPIGKRDEILERALGELGEIAPQSKVARLERAVVVREANSTPSFLPGMEAQRLRPDTPFANLFLAGDWTATGWPPTMEGAVRSGYRAAERVTEAVGKPQQFLVPDLPSGFLARFLMRGTEG